MRARIGGDEWTWIAWFWSEPVRRSWSESFMADQLCSAPFSSIGAAMLKMLTGSPQPRMMLTQQIVCREIGQYSVNCENISGESCYICIVLQTAALLLHCGDFIHCVTSHDRLSAHSMCMA